MAITERDFEKLNKYEQRAWAQRVSMEDDPDATAEQWAHNMYDALYTGVIEACGPVHVGYFMLEDDFHKRIHEVFIEKLGITEAPASAEPEVLFTVDGVEVLRQGFFRDYNNLSSIYGINYTAIPLELG